MTVYLNNHREAIINECLRRNEPLRTIPRQVIEQTLDLLSPYNIRYNTATGKTLKGNSWISQYCDTADLPKYETAEQAAIWEFTGYVRSEAGRLRMGYSI